MRLQIRLSEETDYMLFAVQMGSHWSVCVLSFYTAFRSIRRLTETVRDGVVLNTGWNSLFLWVRRPNGIDLISTCPKRPCSPRKQATLPLSSFLYPIGLINGPTRWNLLILCPHFKTKALPKSENDLLPLIQNNTRCSDGRANDYFILREMFS